MAFIKHGSPQPANVLNVCSMCGKQGFYVIDGSCYCQEHYNQIISNLVNEEEDAD